MKFISTAALLTLGLGAMFPTLAQTVPMQALHQQNDITISGTVGRVVGYSFTLNNGPDEIMVEASPRWYQPITVVPGEQLIVVGEYTNGGFEAHRITRANGDVISMR
ncbi:hypothetical protein [Nodosilinea sp. E11]|uniref:hypothetical protein n=1 Tax=Nodosilinea sp. E11 TaxID=3037479 RepID=UPI0029351958|nr:hypothetical protein [Nodosilinea sp. E11]WOD41357.1 hypothetical protein RRF56_11185 [Nodosilinea sp. E11]